MQIAGGVAVATHLGSEALKLHTTSAPHLKGTCDGSKAWDGRQAWQVAIWRRARGGGAAGKTHPLPRCGHDRPTSPKSMRRLLGPRLSLYLRGSRFVVVPHRQARRVPSDTDSDRVYMYNCSRTRAAYI